MSRAYSDIAFTPTVREVQTRLGSRANYAPLDAAPDRRDALGAAEVEFIAGRDGFYQATVGETGWPYVQFRGGPAGFLKVLDAKTVAYADFRGNVQYISTGNLEGDGRVAIILMDYANQRRLKLFGRARLVPADADPALIALLQDPAYRARVERAVVISVEGHDWNCPQHITPRFTEAEIEQATAPLRQELARLRGQAAPPAAPPERLGSGPLELVITGIRQLTPRVRAFELRAADEAPLPAVDAGAHLDVPVRLADGAVSTRRYSIASNPARRDAWEIAVLLEEGGSGGSRAAHRDFRLGLRLACGLPGNDFALHGDSRPAVLVAGGIGITPLKAMAQQLQAAGRPFHLHYAVKSRREAAYGDRLALALGKSLSLYPADEGRRLDPAALVADAPADAVFYTCGPARLMDAVAAAARAAGVAPERIRQERFGAALVAGDQPLRVHLAKSGRSVDVPAGRSILDAVEAAGIAAASGCRAGQCGTCAVKVLSGEPEHRDTALSETERRQAGLMCICVSRARGGELALDL